MDEELELRNLDFMRMKIDESNLRRREGGEQCPPDIFTNPQYLYDESEAMSFDSVSMLFQNSAIDATQIAGPLNMEAINRKRLKIECSKSDISGLDLYAKLFQPN